MKNANEIKIGKFTLEKIIERHNHWLKEDCDDCQSMRADLSFADLRGVNLRCANLRHACLRGVNLEDAYLEDADLSFADLRYANLRDAHLQYANLRRVNLNDTDLRGADLRDSDLRNADLRRVYLNNADLRRVNLNEADLRDSDLRDVHLNEADLRYAELNATNLRGAYLNNANLRGTSLDNAINVPYIPMACPSDGSFIAWKKVNKYLIKLEIPDDAKRCSSTTNKCRASKAKVLGIYDLYGSETTLTHILNQKNEIAHVSELDYIVGETVFPDSFDENRWNECSHGIHFFINKQDAINY